MITGLIGVTLRSLFDGVVAVAGLWAFQIHNVLVPKVAWGLTLVSRLAMPLLMAITKRVQLLPARTPGALLPGDPMTLLEELQARLDAKSRSGDISKPVASSPLAGPISTPPFSETAKSSGAGPTTAPASHAQESAIQHSTRPEPRRSGYRQHSALKVAV